MLTSSVPLADIFLRERLAHGGAWPGTPAEAEETLRGQFAAAQRAWPEIALSAERFVKHLAQRLTADAPPQALAAMRAADLYIARAAADGDANAIAAFEARYFGEVDAAAARMRAPADAAVEVKQRLRRLLFVREGDRPAATETFAGHGDLRCWLRVTVVRELLRLLGKDRREVHVDDEELLGVLSPADDPELGYLRDRYRKEVAEAVSAAMAAAPARERALLRYHVLEGLNLDQIGALYGAHRATVARWLLAARGIGERTREELSRRFGIAAPEVDSIIRLVQSRLDVSMERILR